MTQPFRGHDVLFLCRDNAVLSPMAEVLLNHWGRGRFRAASAGWNPAIGVHAAAARVLRRADLCPSRLRPRSWMDVEPTGAPAFRFIVLVGRDLPDRAAPVFTGDPILARWQVDPPRTGARTPDAQDRDFERALREIEARVKLFASLPLESLDRLTVERRLTEIDMAMGPGARETRRHLGPA